MHTLLIIVLIGGDGAAAIHTTTIDFPTRQLCLDAASELTKSEKVGPNTAIMYSQCIKRQADPK